ncbi:MAG: dihydroorotate dehydrogenase [Candidatus Micrarchaeota archaeon]
MIMIDISTEFFGKKIKNPLILASGVLGVTRGTLESVCEHGCGAVTTKSLSLEPKKGHEGPNIVETECGLLNAMGYPNPGIDTGLQELNGWKMDDALIISIVGKDAKEFGQLAAKIELAKKELGASAVEAVISCPHTPGYGMMAGQGTCGSITEITNAIKENTKLPLIMKLSPSVPGEVAAAKAAEQAGADAINMGNSLGPGMKIDINRKSRLPGFGMGGLSGPAIKPIAIRCVYFISEAIGIPVIGTGGVNSGADAIEMMMAGANYVGVGTSVYYRGIGAFGEISNEISDWMKMNGYAKLKDIVGAAHSKK